MDSTEISSSPPSESGRDSARIAATASTQPSSTPTPKHKRAQPVPGDFTSRLVNILIWFALGAAAGLAAQLATSRRPPNMGGALGVGLATAAVCAYKDAEQLQISPSFLSSTRKFCNRFENNLDTHSEQLADNSAGQERLEGKLDRLSERVDTLTLAMTRSPAPSRSQQLLAKEAEPPAPEIPLNDSSLNGNGHTSRLGTGF